MPKSQNALPGLFRATFAAFSILSLEAPGASAADRVGVYYFPGWVDSPWAPPGAWTPIEKYPDRKPLLGWYAEGSTDVMATQLKWMAAYGLDYVAFDWYFSHGEPRLGHAIDAYLKVPQTKVHFSIFWANHDEPTTPAIWQSIVQIWIDRYFGSSNYLTVAGKPVVSLMSFENLRNDAAASHSSVSEYVATAQRMARAAGLPGIYLVGGSDDMSTDAVRVEAVKAGFNAISAYNFHRKPVAAAKEDPANWGRPTHAYSGLDAAYRAQWREGVKLPIGFVVPMTTGWDRRPWGGSSDPLHDKSISTNAQFRAHLAAGRKAMETPGPAQSGLGIICCWNEYGEGSFLEPTQTGKFGKLEQVRSIFLAK